MGSRRLGAKPAPDVDSEPPAKTPSAKAAMALAVSPSRTSPPKVDDAVASPRRSLSVQVLKNQLNSKCIGLKVRSREQAGTFMCQIGGVIRVQSGLYHGLGPHSVPYRRASAHRRDPCDVRGPNA